MEDFKGTKDSIAKQILLNELAEQVHPEKVEDVIFWALEYYRDNNKCTWGSTIANCIVERIKRAENKALGKEYENG